ncbi:MAG: metallopeptidase [Mycobacterium sp.]|uniref:PepSY domain-containing protein n=1 Tax=Mycobacterium sp. TaxID=1785 RepID=UPI00262CCA2B|nr:metallopeptidase [Mycobacterium sp.]MDI3314018.1 metallopeptidase [Mycobacterium sp.]
MPFLTRRSRLCRVVIFVAIAGLCGCGHSGNPGATSATTTTKTATWSRPASPPDPQVLLRAGAAAVKQVPGGTLISIRSEQSGAWKVQVATTDGTDESMDVSSDGVTVMVGPTPRKESDTDKAKIRARVQAARLDYRAAVGKMLAAVHDGSITDLKLGQNNGVTVWEADVWDTYIVEHKVTVNAVTGELIANKQV